MFDNLKSEMEKYLKDLHENVKNKEDFLYVEKRTEKFLDVILDEFEKLAKYKEDQIDELFKSQEDTKQRIEDMTRILKNIEKDIYDDDESDFEIICPYCGNEFDADVDEKNSEIKCPECGNSIELDWTGNPDDDDDSGCGGSCSHCGGCGA